MCVVFGSDTTDGRHYASEARVRSLGGRVSAEGGRVSFYVRGKSDKDFV